MSDWLTDLSFHNMRMKTMRFLPQCLFLVLATLVMPVWAGPGLVPWPKSVEQMPGALVLSPRSRIVAENPALAPLVRILAQEIRQITGLELDLAQEKPAAGDIVLAVDARLAGEAYRVEVADRANVSGGNYGAVVLGTATLLQSMSSAEGKVTVPRMRIADQPAYPFRGLLVDVARHYHSIDSLKQIVQLCRLYKVRYLQLHLTDDPAFTFPSTAYPQITSKNHHGGPTYTLEELKDLVAYADARYVTIIPEYEVPGHSGAANRAMPDLFKIKGTRPYEHHASINFAKEDVMKAVATIIGEMCEVFKSSPYFHIGGDEADLAFAAQNADFQAAFKKYNVPNQHELYRCLLSWLDDIVKKNGKQMIVWEGFGRNGKTPVPKDMLVMAYEIRFYRPDHLLADGYKTVNASWTPLYVVNANCRLPREIYAWEAKQFKPYGAKPADAGTIVAPCENLLGSHMCAWEQREVQELPTLKYRLPAMMERVWNPAAGKTYEDFYARLSNSDRAFDLLAHGIAAKTEGLADPTIPRFEKAATVTLLPGPIAPGAIRYTIDAKDPSPDSPAYAQPIRMTATTDLRAQAFDSAGKAIGHPWRMKFEFDPIRAVAEGLEPGARFSKPFKLTLQSGAEGEIRYTLDGKEPKADSPLYKGPITIEKATKVKAALFVNKKRQSVVWEESFQPAKSKQ